VRGAGRQEARRDVHAVVRIGRDRGSEQRRDRDQREYAAAGDETSGPPHCRSGCAG
jgi:hypothetical protein